MEEEADARYAFLDLPEEWERHVLEGMWRRLREWETSGWDPDVWARQELVAEANTALAMWEEEEEADWGRLAQGLAEVEMARVALEGREWDVAHPPPAEIVDALWDWAVNYGLGVEEEVEDANEED